METSLSAKCSLSRGVQSDNCLSCSQLTDFIISKDASSCSVSDFLLSAESVLLESYSNRVGGHSEFYKIRDSKYLLKTFNANELNFYQSLAVSECSSLIDFIPKCLGSISMRTGSELKSFIVFEDLVNDFQNPCIIDLKMGLRQRSLKDATLEKFASTRLKSISSTSHTHGFRVCGVRYFDCLTNKEFFVDKYNGRKMDEFQAYLQVQSYFDSIGDHDGGIHKSLVLEHVRKSLADLKNRVSLLKGVRFWSSSLFISFDMVKREIGIERKDNVIVKLIDFTNTVFLRNSNEPDFELLFGIESLENMLFSFWDKTERNNVKSLDRSNMRPDYSVQDREHEQYLELLKSSLK